MCDLEENYLRKFYNPQNLGDKVRYISHQEAWWSELLGNWVGNFTLWAEDWATITMNVWILPTSGILPLLINLTLTQKCSQMNVEIKKAIFRFWNIFWSQTYI